MTETEQVSLAVKLWTYIWEVSVRISAGDYKWVLCLKTQDGFISHYRLFSGLISVASQITVLIV
jgi:hypothetical protein